MTIIEHYRTPHQVRALALRRLGRWALAAFVVGVAAGLAAPEVWRAARWVWGY